MCGNAGECGPRRESGTTPRARIDGPASRSLGELHDAFRALPEIDVVRWRLERAEDDALLGDDDPVGDADV